MDLKTEEQSEPLKRTVTIRPMHVVIGILCILIFAFAIFRIVTLHWVKQKLDVIRAEGYPVTLDDLDAWYPEVPPGMNAADAYADAFSAYFPGGTGSSSANPSEDQESRIRDWERRECIPKLPVVGTGDLPALSEPIPAEMLDDIAWYMKKNGKAIDFFFEGATISECRYPVDLTQGSNVRLSHLAHIRHGARLLYLEAILAAEKDDSERAVQAVTSSLALAHSLRKEPVFISRLVRIACNNISCGSLERVLSRVPLSDEHLVRLSAALASEEDIEAMTRAMVAERCQGIGHFRTPGPVKTARGSSNMLWKGLDILYCASGVRELDLNKYLQRMDYYVEQSRRPFPERFATSDRELNSVDLPRYCVLTHMLTPALARAHQEDGKAIARLRCAMTAVAIERYRLANSTLPENLDAMIPEFMESIPQDPFDGKPLRFKKQEKGYVVYSIGMNQTDDGGTDSRAQNASRYTGQPLDILFTVER